jgi:prepilin-type N-terminal cleavage/methylation domain-containing protein
MAVMNVCCIGCLKGVELSLAMFCIKRMYKFSRYKAFTLIELSIVIVIIGLIVAGVLGGQSLVRQAKLFSIISDINKYQAAINTFKAQYEYLPGDIPNAYSYWGSTFSCSDNTTDSGCNGDGDRYIDHSGTEKFKMWMHLQGAKLVGGSFRVVDSSTFTPDDTCPATPLSGCYFGYAPNAHYGRVVNLIEASDAHSGIIGARDAYNIDVKMDDGDPSLGKVVTLRSWPSNSSDVCVTGAYNASAGSISYKLSEGDSKNCRMNFILTFEK